MFSKKIISLLIFLSFLFSSLFADDHGLKVEVLHWWTSGGEAAALNVLKEDLESKGIRWVDSAIAGGGGDTAMTALKAKATAGNPPTAAQMLGFDITPWAELGLLGDLNAVAKAENWDKVIPKGLQKFSKYDGKWIAAPVNVHSVNWVWANKKLLNELKIKQPKTWRQFISAAKKAKRKGYIAFAHGGQAWQDATVFDSIVYSTGGKKFYQKAILDQDPKALNSKDMRKAFDRLRDFSKLLDKNFSGRDWNQSTAMVIEGKAAFQIMGDWAKGEFVKAKKKPNKDFLCFRVPGTQDAVLFNSDQFVMFDVGGDMKKAQVEMAKSVMDPKFQSAFNVVKGSVPARVDVPNRDFDACGKKGMKQLADANKKGTMLGSMAHGHGGVPAVKQAYLDVVTAFINDSGMSSKKAAADLAVAIEAAQE